MPPNDNQEPAREPDTEKSEAPNESAEAKTFTSLQHLEDGLNTDGRAQAKWKSRYPPEARKHIRFDAMYIAVVLAATLLGIILVWNNLLFVFFAQSCNGNCAQVNFDKFALFFFGGMLGGSLFGIKYFYKVVGRGYWNLDRRLWRFFSPFVSGGLALAVGAMVDSGILGLTIKSSVSSAYLAMGFLTGYFADSALAKMQDVADTIFGSGRREPAPTTKSPEFPAKSDE